MKAAAFCPGHITGFFQICEHEDVLRSGSRGAGICLSLGATSEVEVRNGSGSIKVIINREIAKGKVTRDAVSFVLQGHDLDVEVRTALDLPVSQGFGMSAAGSLSAAYALAELLDMPHYEAFRAAHIAEVTNRTGLGDVAAISRGGVTFRKKEGLPPDGVVERIANDLELVAAVVGPSLKTSAVLMDDEKKRKVNSAGQDCYRRLSLCPRVRNFLSLSRDFSRAIGIVPDEVERIVREVEAYGAASVAMLGNSVFAVGDLRRQKEVLAKHGAVYEMRSDTAGPRTIEK